MAVHRYHLKRNSNCTGWVRRGSPLNDIPVCPSNRPNVGTLNPHFSGVLQGVVASGHINTAKQFEGTAEFISTLSLIYNCGSLNNPKGNKMNDELFDLTVKQVIGEVLSNDDVDTAIRNMVADMMGEFIENMRVQITDYRGYHWYLGAEGR